MRAITINTDVELKDLENTLDTFLQGEENLNHIPFSMSAFEEEEIDDNEDAGLEEGIIHIELNIRGNTTLLRL